MHNEASTLEQIFLAACENWPEGDTAAHLEELEARVKTRLASDPTPDSADASAEGRQSVSDAAQHTMEELEQLCDVRMPHDEMVLEYVVAQILPLFYGIVAASHGPRTAFRRLVTKLASRCSPRDTAVLLIAHLADEPRFSESTIAIALALAQLLLRHFKRRPDILGDALAILMPKICTAPVSTEGHLSVRASGPALGASEICTGMEDVFTAFSESIRGWADGDAQKGCCLASCTLLQILAVMNLDCVPLPGVPGCLPLPAAAHFRQTPRQDCGIEMPLALSVIKTVLKLLPMFHVASLPAMLDLATADGRQQTEEEIELGKAILAYCVLCNVVDRGALDPGSGQQQLAASARLVPCLMAAATQAQNVPAAQKGMAFAAVAACQAAGEQGPLAFGPEHRRLLDCAALSMAGNPVQAVRNCASHTFHALLDSLQAEALAQALAHVHQKRWSGVSAQALQCLARRAAHAWPAAGTPETDEWRAIGPALLPAVLEWLEGRHAPADVPSLIFSSEPVCAALNLYRFMLLREQHSGSRVLGASRPEQTKTIRSKALLPLRGLCELSLQEADGEQEALAVARVFEVLSRVLELVEQPRASPS